MSTKYFALLTQLGADKLANAAALGTKIEITHMAVGDGGGSLPTPDTKQTKLINEKRRAAINTLSIDPKNTNQIIAEQVIPENEGGWWIREIGLFDKDGILIAVGNCAETYKPQLQEGSGRTQTIRMILIVSSANAVTLKVDPAVILATREYVDDSIQKHANSRNHPDATLKEKGFVILSSAVDSNSETHAATPKAVKAAYDFANAANNNANGRVPAGRKVNGKALSADIALNSGDVGAYNKGETDTRVNEAKAQAKAANDNANGRVPAGRKVNGKALSADISLNSADVGAYNKAETDARVNEAKAQAKAANDNANGRVPLGRKVNGKALNADISLNAADVGAYNKDETNTKVNDIKSLANTANQNAVNANNNANTRLEKNKNGADIPNKNEFVKNLGLTAGSALPVGVPIPWPLATPPAGWIKCNGATFTATQYPELARVYPSLRLPDLRGEFIRGWDDGRKVDVGRVLLSLQNHAFQNHSHALPTSNGDNSIAETGITTVFDDNKSSNFALNLTNTQRPVGNNAGLWSGNYFRTYSSSVYGGFSVAAETRPRNIAFNYIVRAA
ncbi:phage tail protein [Xenorhabdus miraniensis]|uniref:Tail protein n=1 Tax=Xenorhabdus miraniensis TaxID=351674 RepID=A0A2D0JSC8_9GAMM|nr:phage tail protein [Xenorhabdus miraniensis]PHM49211.1 tail protein [Xenorhabdus miraniensis]